VATFRLIPALVAVLAFAGSVVAGEDYSKEKFKGGIKGVVLFDGEAPKRPKIDTSGDKACHAMHAAEPLRKEDTAIVVDGKLANVIVHLKKGTAKYNYEAPTTPVTLDQKGCRYIPHVLGVMAGQPIEIVNSDALTHNVHGISPSRVNPEFNISQANAGAKDKKKLPEPEVIYTIQCDVHRWMSAKVGVFDHPFFAVTGEDGAFELKNVPPGEYEIEAWHETLPAQTAKVTVAADGAVEQKFTFKK
jgi:plastocyanin